MAAIRHSLAAQFFRAFAVVAVLVIATLGGLFAYSMRDGFSRYLLEGELVGMDAFVAALSEAYDPASPGWPELVSNSQVWNDFLKHHFRPERPEPIRGHIPPPPPGGDPFQISMRVFLLDPAGAELIPPGLRESLSAQRPILAPGASVGDPPVGHVGLTAPRSGRSQSDQFFLRGQYRNLALASLFALALSAAAATLLARHQLRPIKALESGARALANGDFDARIPNDRKDELGQLIDHTNALAESLQASRDAERQWISDTSHELQTPLAVLRAEIEAMQDGIRKADERTLTEMHDSVMRLSRLVADLKLLSFTREGREAVAQRRADLGHLLQDRLDLADGRLTQAGLTLTRSIDTSLDITCDPDRLAQLIDNLLENALRYTIAPGEIHVSARKDGETVVATFDDSPPTPPAEAIPHLFERFFRADASRSRNLGGSGLGLAICAAIVATHGGTISAETSPLGGLRVRIVLPTEGRPSDPQ